MEKLEIKAFFSAIGDYSRFSILMSLLKKDLNVSDIVAETGIEQNNVSHHMACLLNCGFVSVRKEGKERIYHINDEVRPAIASIMEHIEKYKEQILSSGIANKDYILEVSR